MLFVSGVWPQFALIAKCLLLISDCDGKKSEFELLDKLFIHTSIHSTDGLLYIKLKSVLILGIGAEKLLLNGILMPSTL